MKMSMRRKRRTWRWWPGRSKRQIHSRNSRRNGMVSYNL
uniref:Uncharacterized protein n=1 Tax=Rhizophora mucronata TaxID=61149 RepID=A0A2P2PYR6_RHIMU